MLIMWPISGWEEKVIRWIYYPLSKKTSDYAQDVINVFERNLKIIDLKMYKNQTSNAALKKIKADLECIGFDVESGKKQTEKIQVPVLFGVNGVVEKYFEADAYNKNKKWVLEVEAGRAFTNYQFLKDLFHASVMYDVQYLYIAVRNDYRGRDDFLKIKQFFDTMYASNRFSIPLEGILLIGY